MKHLLTIIIAILLLTACSKDDEKETPAVPADRTVIVYIAGENNLSSFIQGDLNEMKAGRQQVTTNESLVVFVDKASNTEKPYIAKITDKGEMEHLYDYTEDFYASAPDKMEEVLRRCMALCPASKDYGLVLWGHADGWIVEDSVDISVAAARRAYGMDSGTNTPTDNRRYGKWINIPSMRKIFSALGIKWKFIFSDCCNMQNIETAYELKDAAEYLIGSPAEIPGIGAPYTTLVPAFFIHNDEQMYKSICDRYYEQTDREGRHLPISVIKTSQLDALAQATRKVLPTVAANVPKDDFGAGHIYYFGLVSRDSWGVTTYLQNEKNLYDMVDIIRWGLTDSPEAYEEWRNVFDQAVIYSRMSTFWHSNLVDLTKFKVTEQNFGGVSMFFPQTKHDNSLYYKHNELIKKTAWYYVVDWPSAGW